MNCQSGVPDEATGNVILMFFTFDHTALFFQPKINLMIYLRTRFASMSSRLLLASNGIFKL